MEGRRIKGYAWAVSAGLNTALAGFFFFCFEESLPVQWFAGALFIVVGLLILNKSSIEMKERID